MSERVRVSKTLSTFGCVAAAIVGTADLAASAPADASFFWGAPGGRTTYSPPFDPSDAPTIPLLKRSTAATGATGVGTEKSPNGKGGDASAGPRVGDSGTFVGDDGKTYYYRFVEGVRRRTLVETRPDSSAPSGWRKVLRRVDEPCLIKQIWPAEILTASPEPCRPVENVVETPEKNGASETANASDGGAPILYRATVRAVVP